MRHALKRAGLLVNVAQPSSRSGPILVLWARHSGDKLWKELPRHGITNHYPGSWALGRKDGLWKHLSAQQPPAKAQPTAPRGPARSSLKG